MLHFGIGYEFVSHAHTISQSELSEQNKVKFTGDESLFVLNFAYNIGILSRH